MLETNREMLSLTNQRTGRCARWGAFIVLLAVCSLAVRVATRYTTPQTPPVSAAKAFRSHSVQEHGRQRLTKDAASWIPPVIVSSPLQEPASYPRVALESPPVANPSFASALYYRPPPFTTSFHSFIGV